MKRYQYRSPNGELILGSKDSVPCRADIDYFDAEDEPEWTGHTEVFWDGQTTERREVGGRREPVYLDAAGDDWVLSQCTREFAE